MRLLIALLLFASLPARAEWIKMGQIEKSSLIFLTSKTVFYIDPASVTRQGDIGKVWQIRDLADKGTAGERSVLEAVEYDCVDIQMRTVSAVGKSRPMAQGETIPLSQATDEWTSLRSGSDFEVFRKILQRVCAP
jgi:hypothetical protein